VLGIRPEAITKASGNDASRHSAAEFEFDCEVDVLEPTGADTLAVISLGGVDVIAKLRPRDGARKHELMRFVADVSTVSLFDPASGFRI
jgi:multiple sugar transport system ATP-binding protein